MISYVIFVNRKDINDAAEKMDFTQKKFAAERAIMGKLFESLKCENYKWV